MEQVRFLDNRGYSTREIAKTLCSDFPELDFRYVQSELCSWFNRMDIPSQNGQEHHRLYSGDDCQRCYNHWFEHYSKRFGKTKEPDLLDAAASYFGIKFKQSEDEVKSDKKDRFNIQINDRPDLRQKIIEFRYSKRLSFTKAVILILETFFEEHPLDTFEDKVSKMSREELAELVIKNKGSFWNMEV